MDEKDSTLVKNIIKEMKKVDDPGNILLDTPTTQIAKTNFFLLKGLLDLEGKKGYYITLDRPHQNMAYLLNNHDINQENIWYIDTVTNIAGEKKANKENVELLDNAFQIEKLTQSLKGDGGKRDDFGSLGDIDFILIDNLGPMLNYNKIEKIQEFVSSFEELVISQDDLIGCLVMDSDINKDLDSTVRDHVKTVINVKKLKEDL
ncbi:MAG: hypothetical protein V5A66_03740 [Candidatus Thermoplasmatota archaeon]